MLIKQEQKQAANILGRGERQLAGSGKIAGCCYGISGYAKSSSLTHQRIGSVFAVM